MTVIAIKKYKNKIQMASDSQTSYGTTHKSTDVHHTIVDKEKIFDVNDMTFGCSGSVKGKNYLKIFAKTHKPKYATVDDVLSFLIEFQHWFKLQDDKYSFDEENSIILVFKNKIFSANGFMVQEINDYWATGSGMFLALGALYFNKTPAEAVEVAKQFDSFCSGETFIKEIKLIK